MESGDWIWALADFVLRSHSGSQLSFQDSLSGPRFSLFNHIISETLTLT